MPDAGWDALVRQQAGVSAEGREVAGELKKSAERAGDIESRLADLKPPSPPDLIEPTKPPTTADLPSPIASFGSVAAAFGMLASLMTRRPLMTALNAATGAIVGAREGNQEEFKRNYEVWKQNSEYANEVNAWQTRRYQMIMDEYKNNIDKMQAELKVEAIRNNDVVMAHTIESGDVRNSENLLSDRTRLGMESQRLHLEIAKQQPLIDATADYNAARKKYQEAVKFGDPAKIAEAKKGVDESMQNIAKVRAESTTAGAFDPNSVEEVAKLIADGKMAPLSAFALRSPWGQAVMARVAQINPAYTGTEYGQRAKAARDFGTGKQGDLVRSMNVSIAHLDTLSRLADALDSGDIQAINRVAQEVAVQTGATPPTNFDSAKEIIGQEIVKAIVGGGGGVTERQDAGRRLDRAQSPPQLKGVIDTTKELLGGQLSGLKRQYENTTGFTNFDDLLSPEAKRELLPYTQSKAKAGDSPQNPATPKNQSEYDALPSGAYFRDDEGLKRKP